MICPKVLIWSSEQCGIRISCEKSKVCSHFLSPTPWQKLNVSGCLRKTVEGFEGLGWSFNVIMLGSRWTLYEVLVSWVVCSQEAVVSERFTAYIHLGLVSLSLLPSLAIWLFFSLNSHLASLHHFWHHLLDIPNRDWSMSDCVNLQRKALLFIFSFYKKPLINFS